jgi:hypothetical protein
MSKRVIRALVGLLLAGLVVGAAVAVAQSNSKFRATMRGSSETPKGDKQGKGTFTVTFRKGQACYRMSVKGISTPVAAHIHKGGAGKNGPIVIDLKPSFKGSGTRVSAKCVSAKASVVSAIRRNPAGYYANVHTKDFPAGAARGQLRKP